MSVTSAVVQIPRRGRLAEALTGWLPVRTAARLATRRSLRVLAYHGVADAPAFSSQLDELAHRWNPVSARQVVAAMRGGAPLPPFAVWVTFDDGRPEVFERGQPLLDRAGISATAFVCPGLIGGDRPPWWDLVERSGVEFEIGSEALAGAALVRRLKEVPDADRRRVVEAIWSNADAPRQRQPTIEDLRRWHAAGHSVGNHTWDHPCLDRCEPAEQLEQVRRADRWLADELGVAERLFAYPNGDWTPEAEVLLGELGVDVACLFDHALARTADGPLRVSRLRVDSDAPLRRFRAILSGAHPIAFGLARRHPHAARRSPRRPAAAASVE